VPDAPLGLALYAHDLGWARRLVEHPPTRDALSRVLAEASFVKHFPDGRLQLQLQAPGRSDLPPVAAMLGWFAQVVATVMAPPAPTPAKPRWSDNTALVMTLITVVVLGGFAAMGWGYYVIVR
jgi:hypothetical protein